MYTEPTLHVACEFSSYSSTNFVKTRESRSGSRTWTLNVTRRWKAGIRWGGTRKVEIFWFWQVDWMYSWRELEAWMSEWGYINSAQIRSFARRTLFALTTMAWGMKGSWILMLTPVKSMREIGKLRIHGDRKGIDELGFSWWWAGSQPYSGPQYANEPSCHTALNMTSEGIQNMVCILQIGSVYVVCDRLD